MRLSEIGPALVKWAGIAALPIALANGGWDIYKWRLAGADDWMINLSLEAEVLPYTKDLRLLVVHVRSKNATGNEVEFKPSLTTFTLDASPLLANLPEKSKVDDCKGSSIAHFDLMADVGDGYVFMPGAEFDDTRAVVVRAGQLVCLSADLQRKDGPRQQPDFVPATRVVYIQ